MSLTVRRHTAGTGRRHGQNRAGAQDPRPAARVATDDRRGASSSAPGCRAVAAVGQPRCRPPSEPHAAHRTGGAGAEPRHHRRAGSGDGSRRVAAALPGGRAASPGPHPGADDRGVAPDPPPALARTSRGARLSARSRRDRRRAPRTQSGASSSPAKATARSAPWSSSSDGRHRRPTPCPRRGAGPGRTASRRHRSAGFSCCAPRPPTGISSGRCRRRSPPPTLPEPVRPTLR